MEPSADVLLRLKDALETGAKGEPLFRDFRWYRSGELAALKRPYALIQRVDSLQRQRSRWWDLEFTVRLVQKKCYLDPEAKIEPDTIDRDGAERILRFGQLVCYILEQQTEVLHDCIVLPAGWAFKVESIEQFGYSEAVGGGGLNLDDDEAEARFTITGQVYRHD